MSRLPTASLRRQVYELMSELPEGLVTTYGDLAAMCGYPNYARIVGNIAHGGPTDLPWHRLVNSRGGLAVGFPGGTEVQRQLLEKEAIACDESNQVIDFERLRWHRK